MGKAEKKVEQVKEKLLESNNVVFQFLRSIVSSQAASWVDMGISFAFFAWLNIMPWLSTLCGAFAGGILNCILNYKFTFHAQGVPWKAVIVKYILVWVGSVALNSVGTDLLYHLVNSITWLHHHGFNEDGIFAAARLLVSLIVSLGWNFVLQRNFVYRTTKFDPKAIKIVNTLFPLKK